MHSNTEAPSMLWYTQGTQQTLFSLHLIGVAFTIGGINYYQNIK